MALYSGLRVDKDVYHLVLKISEYAKGFSRQYKRAPGQDLRRDRIVLVCMRTRDGVSSSLGFTVKR
jgi:hypothetical protein